MGRVVYLDSIPDCDFCAKDNGAVPAIVDGPTVFGSHAYMCNHHRKRYALNGHPPAGTHPLENPIALKKATPPPPAPGTVGAVIAQKERDRRIAEYVATADMDELQAMMFDMVPCEAVDGCIVEPDSQCEHGYPSKLRAIGIG